jgi:hypothetical protein
VTSKAHSPSVRARQARIYSRPAEAGSLADRVQVDREGGRVRVTLTRKYRRVFYLGDDETSYLAGLLAKQVPPVTVTRVEARGEVRLSLACRAGAHTECTITWCGCTAPTCHHGNGEGES